MEKFKNIVKENKKKAIFTGLIASALISTVLLNPWKEGNKLYYIPGQSTNRITIPLDTSGKYAVEYSTAYGNKGVVYGGTFPTYENINILGINIEIENPEARCLTEVSNTNLTSSVIASAYQNPSTHEGHTNGVILTNENGYCTVESEDQSPLTVTRVKQ